MTYDLRSLAQNVKNEQTRPEKGLDCSANHPFYLMHKGSWFCRRIGEQPYWLPLLKPLPLSPGANRIKPARQDGQPPQSTLARAKMLDAGWSVLDRDPEAYLVQYPARPRRGTPGVYYATRWDIPVPGDGGTEWDHDDDGYHRWLHGLVTDGAIPRPHPRQLDKVKAAAMRPLHRLESTQGNSYTDNQLSRWKQQIKDMETAILPGDDGDPLVTDTATKRTRRKTDVTDAA